MVKILFYNQGLLMALLGLELLLLSSLHRRNQSDGQAQKKALTPQYTQNQTVHCLLALEESRLQLQDLLELSLQEFQDLQRGTRISHRIVSRFLLALWTLTALPLPQWTIMVK